MVQRSKDSHNKVITSSLQGIIEMHIKDNTCLLVLLSLHNVCNKTLPLQSILIFPVLAPYGIPSHCQATCFSSVLSLIIDLQMTLSRQACIIL